MLDHTTFDFSHYSLKWRLYQHLRDHGPHTARQLAERLAPGALATGEISKGLRALEADGLAARTRQRPALWTANSTRSARPQASR